MGKERFGGVFVLTTLYYLLGRREKESALFIFIADLIVLLSGMFLLGRMLVWVDVVILSVIIVSLNIPVRKYAVWREKERMRLLHGRSDWNVAFPQKWVPYADLWVQLLGSGMTKVHIAALILGKCSEYVF